MYKFNRLLNYKKLNSHVINQIRSNHTNTHAHKNHTTQLILFSSIWLSVITFCGFTSAQTSSRINATKNYKSK